MRAIATALDADKDMQTDVCEKFVTRWEFFRAYNRALAPSGMPYAHKLWSHGRRAEDGRRERAVFRLPDGRFHPRSCACA
jgi:hypothetical protein